MKRQVSSGKDFVSWLDRSSLRGSEMVATLGEMAGSIPGFLGIRSYFSIYAQKIRDRAGQSMDNIAGIARNRSIAKDIAPGKAAAAFMARRFDTASVFNLAASTTCIQHESIIPDKTYQANACRVRDGIVASWLKDKNNAPIRHFFTVPNPARPNNLLVYKQDWNSSFVPVEKKEIDEEQERVWQKFVTAYPRDMLHYYYIPDEATFKWRTPFVVDLVERIARDERVSGKKGRSAQIVWDVMRDPEISNVMNDFGATREPVVAKELATKMMWARPGKYYSTDGAIRNFRTNKNPLVGDGAIDIITSGGKLPPRFDTCDFIRDFVGGQFASTPDGMSKAKAFLDEKC